MGDELSLLPVVETELRLGGELQLAVLATTRIGYRKKQLAVVRWEGETDDGLSELWRVVAAPKLFRGDFFVVETFVKEFFSLGGSDRLVRAGFSGTPPIVHLGQLFVGTRDAFMEGVYLDRWGRLEIPGKADGVIDVVFFGSYCAVQHWEELNAR